MSRHSRSRLIVPFVLLVLAGACRDADAPRPRYEARPGWLVAGTGMPAITWSHRRLGDGKHVVAVKVNGKGVYFLDREARLHGPLLPEVNAFGVLETGDGDHVLVRGDDSQLYLLSRSTGASRNVMPKGHRLVRPYKRPDGIWVSTTAGYEGERYLSFFARNDHRMFGPWQVTDGYDHAGPFVVDVLPPGSGTSGEIRVLDPRRGPLLLPLSLQGAPASHGAGCCLWLSSDKPGIGVWRISVADAFEAAGAGKPYEPGRFLEHEGDLRVDTAVDDVAWVVASSKEGFDLRTSVYVIDGGTVRRVALTTTDVTGFVALEDGGCLAEVSSGHPRVVHISRAGEVTEIPAPLFFFGPEIEPSHSFTVPGHVMFDTPQGLFDFDIRRKLVRKVTNDQVETHVDGSLIWLARNVPRKEAQRGVFLYDPAAGAIVDAANPLFAQEPYLPTMVGFGDGRTWVTNFDLGGVRLIRSDFRGALGLTLGDTELSPTGAPREIPFDPAAGKVRVTLPGWPAWAKLHEKAELLLRIRSAGGDPLELKSSTLGTSGVHDVHVIRAPRNGIPYGKDVTIDATLTDPLGTRLTWTWSGIRFTPPQALIDRPWFRSLLLFFAVCVLGVLGAGLRGGLQRWMPILIYVAGTGAGIVTAVGKTIDGPLFLGLMLAAMAVATLSGVFSPAVFRELERVEPFRSLAPLALSLPSMRRRLYAGYAARVRANVESVRKGTRGEVYAELPVNVLDSRQIAIDESAPPAEALVVPLTSASAKHRGHVLIMSPGGRGKSALVRQIVLTALDAFGRDPSRPLPIVCAGSKPSLFERASTALEADGFSDELLRTLLRSGEFFLVVDGLTENSVTPEMLGGHVTAFGTRCPLLLAGRPNEELRKTVETTGAWVVVEPCWLDEDTLPRFLAAYGRTAADFDGDMRALCRNEAGRFLPILVRLAIVPAPRNRARSVGDIYRLAFEELIAQKNPQLFDQAVELCMNTYWIDGERQLAYATAPLSEKAVMKDLLDAGVLVPADLGSAASRDIRTVKFFHDTMQSYLTAVGLARQDDWRGVLETAAGADRFARDRSELGGEGAELFQLCVHVFEPRSRLRETLRSALLQYAEEWGSSLSRDWVVEAAGLPDLHAMAGPRMAGGDVLEMAVDLAAKTEDVAALGRLYGRVIRQLWPRLAKRGA